MSAVSPAALETVEKRCSASYERNAERRTKQNWAENGEGADRPGDLRETPKTSGNPLAAAAAVA